MQLRETLPHLVEWSLSRMLTDLMIQKMHHSAGNQSSGQTIASFCDFSDWTHTSMCGQQVQVQSEDTNQLKQEG